MPFEQRLSFAQHARERAAAQHIDVVVGRRSTDDGIFFEQHDLRAYPRRADGYGNAGRACADDEDVGGDGVLYFLMGLLTVPWRASADPCRRGRPMCLARSNCSPHPATV